jgi:hypothetical protein
MSDSSITAIDLAKGGTVVGSIDTLKSQGVQPQLHYAAVEPLSPRRPAGSEQLIGQALLKGVQQARWNQRAGCVAAAGGLEARANRHSCVCTIQDLTPIAPYMHSSRSDPRSLFSLGSSVSVPSPHCRGKSTAKSEANPSFVRRWESSEGEGRNALDCHASRRDRENSECPRCFPCEGNGGRWA